MSILHNYKKLSLKMGKCSINKSQIKKMFELHMLVNKIEIIWNKKAEV